MSASPVGFPSPTPATWADLDHAARVTAVRTMAALGNTGAQIAEALAASRNAVLGIAHRNAIKLGGMRYAVGYVQEPRFAVHAPVAEATWAPMAPPVTLDQLTSRSCRWPVGPDSGSAQLYCGCRRHRGSYCADHARLAYRPRAGDRDYADELRLAGRTSGVPAEVTVDEARVVLGLIVARKEVAE